MKFQKTMLSASIAAALLFAATAQAQATQQSQPAASEQQRRTAQPADQQATATDQATTPSGKTKTAKKKKKRQSLEQQKLERLSTITVRGIAGSQERDLALKRFAPQIEDSITAQNIGQLPDVDISDAISRIPGVQIGRSGGEGTTISINGLPEIRQTLNGETYLSPGGGSGLLESGDSPDLASGQPDFVDILPTLFRGVDVIKSMTASNLAGGVSGIINLRTYRPFDFKKGWTFSGSLQGYTGSRVKKLNKQASFLASYRTDRWGLLVNVGTSTEHIANTRPKVSLYGLGVETTQQDVGFNWNGGSTLGNSTSSDTLPTDFYYNWDPTLIDSLETYRKRNGASASFEYKFNDSLKLIAEGLYTHFNERNTSYGYQLSDNSVPGELQAGPVRPVISSTGMFLKGISDIYNFVQYTEEGSGPSDSLNTNLQLDYDSGGLLSGSLRWVHGKAYRSESNAGEDSYPIQGDTIPLSNGTTPFVNPNGIPGRIPVLLDYLGTLPSFDVLDNVTNPSQYILGSAYAGTDRINADLNVFSGNATLHFDAGVLDSFQFGARYEKQSDVFNTGYYLSPLKNSGCADPTGTGPNDAYFRFQDPTVLNNCTGFSQIPVVHLSDLPSGWLTTLSPGKFAPLSLTGPGMAKAGLPAVNAAALKDPVAFLESTHPGTFGTPRLFQSPDGSYDVHETIASVYAQFNLSGEAFDRSWHMNVGIRPVRTTLYIGSFPTDSTKYYGNGGEFNGVYVNEGERIQVNKYTTWLPAFNLAYNVTPNGILRFAYNKTEARQSLSNLGQGLVQSFAANGNPPRDPSLPENAQLFASAYGGNPNLKPYVSKNLNLSYGWYFNPQSIAYLGAFWMDVASFPESITTEERLPDADGVVRRSGPVSTLINGPRSIIHGLEAEFRTQFAFLPGPWSGLGVNLNYTYLNTANSEAGGGADSYNAILFYQKYGLQMRVAYNWVSKNLVDINSSTSNTLDIYAKPTGYLDASVEYAVNKNLDLVFQGTNLTDNYDPEYVQYPYAWWTYDINQRTYYAGIRFHF